MPVPGEGLQHREWPAVARLLNSFRTRDVPPWMLASTDELVVHETGESLAFIPVTPNASGLIVVCGAGPAAEAYAPLLRPLADAGFPVIVIRLPFRIAPLESHKSETLDRVHRSMSSHPQIQHWVLAGHSLGGKLASRFALGHADALAALDHSQFGHYGTQLMDEAATMSRREQQNITREAIRTHLQKLRN